VPASAHADLSGLGLVLHLPGLAGSVAPGLIAVGLIIAVLASVGASRYGSRRRPPSAALPLWACGADDLTARMQYTATSFAEPLQRVFDDVLRPDTDIEVTAFEESQYLVAKVAYRTRISDAVQDLLYTPVIRAVALCANAVRRAHTGSVHLYLAYGALGVLIVLLVAQ
jgi:hydrogenase-4 component B